MFSKLRSHLSFANVTSLLALFIALGGTSAYAINEWTGANIVDESITSADIKNLDVGTNELGIGSVWGSRIRDNAILSNHVVDNVLTGNDIKDHSLKDDDIAEGTYRHFDGNIQTVAANHCAYYPIEGINAQNDHLVLTPNFQTADHSLTYAIQYNSNTSEADLQVCNPTAANIDDGYTKFNLLVIDAN